MHRVSEDISNYLTANVCTVNNALLQLTYQHLALTHSDINLFIFLKESE